MKSLRSLRVEAGISGAELANLLKPMFPRVNKAIICYAEDPCNTGVTVTPSMRKEIEVQTGREFRSADAGRKDGYHFSFWVDETAYSEFNALRASLGLETGKETFIQLIKNAARSVPANEQR